MDPAATLPDAVTTRTGGASRSVRGTRRSSPSSGSGGSTRGRRSRRSGTCSTCRRRATTSCSIAHRQPGGAGPRPDARQAAATAADCSPAAAVRASARPRGLTPAATHGRERERGSAARCSSPRSPLGARADCRPRPDRCLPRTVRRAGRRTDVAQPSSASDRSRRCGQLRVGESVSRDSQSHATQAADHPELVRARRRGVVGIVVG